MITSYYNYILLAIDCLRKSCNGPCIDNQNSLVNDTSIVTFIKTFISIGYEWEHLTNARLALLKFKLLLLLLSLIEGRQENDPIKTKIIKDLPLSSIQYLMKETLDQIMKEKKISSVENLVLSNDMYARFESNDMDKNENFIIFINWFNIVLNIICNLSLF